MKKLFLLFLLMYSSLNALEILYELNPPYIQKQNDTISGVVVTPTIKALDNLNIKYTLKEESFKNQLTLLKTTDRQICTIGWFKNTKLEKLVNYSESVYKDKPYGIITQKRYKIEDNTHIDRMIKERKYRVMVKKHHGYDSKMISILNMLPKKIVNTNKDYNMVNLIAKRRGDYTFMPYEKAQMFEEKHKYRSRFKFVTIAGMPEGQNRYFACSKKIDPAILSAFNTNLK